MRELWDFDPNAPPEIIYFPVRHYSPMSSKMLHDIAADLKPTCVLIEGPSDFNDRIEELYLDQHKLPIAIYSYVRLSDGSKRSGFHPFTEYAPEWQALQVAKDLGVPAEFIDLAWPEMAMESDRAHRYNDDAFRENPYPAYLCEKMHVNDFDELWDEMFELDDSVHWHTYLERCHTFCHHLRIFGGSEDPENIAREACMVERIDGALERLGGPVLVVTGGFHSSGLYAKRHGFELDYIEFEPEVVEPEEDDQQPESSPEIPVIVTPEMVQQAEDAEPEEPPSIVESGITLTPFSYQRIDKMSGYMAGIHGPSFYRYVWRQRKSNQPVSCEPFLFEIVQKLRNKGQIASTADVIAIESTARALATLRGRTEVWRFDLLDAIGAAVVKEAQDAEYMHPVLLLAREVLRGVKRGYIDPRANLPPILRAANNALTEYDLFPTDDARDVTLDLADPRDRQRSALLHQCRVLGIAGFQLTQSVDFVGREDLTDVSENWTIRWLPEYEATLIENAVYGSDLVEAAASRAVERAVESERDAEKASLVAIDAALMGLAKISGPLFERIADSVASDQDFFKVSTALGHILFLYRFDEILGTQSDPRIGELLLTAYERSLWLYESLGSLKDRENEFLTGVQTLFLAFRRCHPGIIAERDGFVRTFERIGDDEDQAPIARGASMGALYTLDELAMDRVLDAIVYFSDPMELSDFLVGFFSLAREAAQRDPRLIEYLDAVISRYTEEEFLIAAPGFRLAFTFFTPLEKHRIVDMLFAKQDNKLKGASPQDKHDASSMNERIRQTAERFGLRLPDPCDNPNAQEGTPTASQGGQPSGSQGQDGGQSGAPAGGQSSSGSGKQSGAGGQSGSGSGKQSGTSLADMIEELGGAPCADGEREARWRVVLGAGTEGAFGELSGEWQMRDKLLAFLYDREYGQKRNVRGNSPEGRQGGLGESQLSVPDWINGVHELFPKRTIERLEKDAIDRYAIEEIVTRPEVLRNAQPNPTLLKAVLRTKHLMDREVLEIARHLVRQVIEELMKKLAKDIKQPFVGAINRRRRSMVKVAKNFDAPETIRRNLKYFDSDNERLVIRDPFFFSRIKRHSEKWRIMVVVDQSGSMLDSVIHSAITASIFYGIKTIKTDLIAFDTSIVDLTGDAGDPVETLMKVQLGGGTDIANALEYTYSKITDPHRTIIVLVTDFYEGGPVQHLLSVTKTIIDSGAILLGLAALDEDANPDYDRQTAANMVRLGAEVGAMTPADLAEWVAEKIR